MTDKQQRWQTNQRDIKGDGRVVIYQRRRAKDGSINPTWYMRLLPNGTDKYFVKSTRNINEFEAGKVALQKYEEFQVRALSGASIHQKAFSAVYEEWKKDYPTSVGSKRKKEYIHKDIAVLGAYPYQFFVEQKKDLPIEDLDDTKIFDFYSWRRENTFRNGKKHIPADDTLRKEMNLLTSLLTFAARKKYIVEVPKLSAPSVEDNRRPAFTDAEYVELGKAAARWEKQAKHPSVRRDRFYLRHYFLILTNSGIRVGEARDLCWGNIYPQSRPEGHFVVANVVGKTSTSTGRDVILDPRCERYLERLYDWRRDELGKDPDPSEPIFCHKDGKAVGSYKKSFASLLEYASLTYNTRGQKRVLYSLRHTYATRTLRRAPVYFVAKNMGTSVKMIERFYGQANLQQTADAVLNDAPELRETKSTRQKKYPFRR